MSGGHFEYNQFKLTDFADALYYEIEKNTVKDEYGDCFNFPDNILDKLKEVNILLNKVADLAHAADYLYSGDYGEDCFLSKLKEFENKDYSYKSPNERDGVIED